MPRKYSVEGVESWRTVTCFNEAGADAPEIRDFTEECAMFPKGFNEAGADAPEIHPTTLLRKPPILASMRPGRMPRKYSSVMFGLVNSIKLQ